MTATTVFPFLVFLMLFFISTCVGVSFFSVLIISQVRSAFFSFFLAPFRVFRHGHSMQFHYLHLAASGYARHRIVSIWVGIA